MYSTRTSVLGGSPLGWATDGTAAVLSTGSGVVLVVAGFSEMSAMLTGVGRGVDPVPELHATVRTERMRVVTPMTADRYPYSARSSPSWAQWFKGVIIA